MKNDNLIYLRSVMERMTTEQLDELLHEELAKETPNGEIVRQALKVLEDREKDIPVKMTPEIEAVWENYRKNVEPVSDKPVCRHSWILKVASVVAVLLLVFLILPQQAEAKSIFERIVSWTDSFFQLINPGDAQDCRREYVFETDNPGLQQVYDAVVELGITDPVVPMWLPEGYELVECKVTEMPTNNSIVAKLTDGNSALIFRIYSYSANMSNKYYKNVTQADTFEVGGTTYNIIRNREVWASIWTQDNLECTIMIDCQEDVFYEILRSIYMMEDE